MVRLHAILIVLAAVFSVLGGALASATVAHDGHVVTTIQACQAAGPNDLTAGDVAEHAHETLCIQELPIHALGTQRHALWRTQLMQDRPTNLIAGLDRPPRQ